jgi:hypothetical protein
MGVGFPWNDSTRSPASAAGWHRAEAAPRRFFAETKTVPAVVIHEA